MVSSVNQQENQFFIIHSNKNRLLVIQYTYDLFEQLFSFSCSSYSLCNSQFTEAQNISKTKRNPYKNTFEYYLLSMNGFEFEQMMFFFISSLSLPLTISSVIFIHLFYTHAIFFWIYEFILGTCMTLQYYTFYHLKFSVDLHSLPSITINSKFTIENHKIFWNCIRSVSFKRKKVPVPGAQWNQFHAFKFPKNKIIYFNKIISLNKHCFPEIFWYFFIW